MNVKIKICGITSGQEAAYLNKNSVDFAGMVLFFPKSRRNIDIPKAKNIMAALNSSIKKVAVVVAPTLHQVEEIYAAGFDYVQIHGDIPQGIQDVGIPVLKAFNVSDMEQYEQYRDCSYIAGYVLDAQTPGSGQTFDWSLLDNLPRDGKLLLLAGGLTPENVEEAVRYVHPDGVDVSSGVENDNKAGKSEEKIKRFIENARKGK